MAHPSVCRDTSERDASLAGYSSLPSEPSHYAHFFCALSRYGVTTVRSFPHADSLLSGIRDVCSDQDRLFRAKSLRCFRRMSLMFVSSTIRSASSRWTSLGVALSRSSQSVLSDVLDKGGRVSPI